MATYTPTSTSLSGAVTRKGMFFRTGPIGDLIYDIYKDMDTGFAALEGTLTAEYDAIVAETASVGRKLKLVEGTSNGTNSVTMSAPASIGSDRTITLPDADVDLTELNSLATRYRTPVLTVGAEVGNVIEVSVQVSDLDGSVAAQHYVRAKLVNANPDSGGVLDFTLAAGGAGSILWASTIVTGDAASNEEGAVEALCQTDASGVLELDIEDTTTASTATAYVVVEVVSEVGGTAFMSAPAVAVVTFA